MREFRAVGEGLVKRMAFEQKFEGSEGTNDGDLWRENFRQRK